MLEFKVAVEKSGVVSYLKQKNIDLDIKGFFVMSAMEGETIVGMGAVSMTPDFAVVEELVCDDETIAYGMGKALLNSLDLGGVARVLIKNERLYPLAERLRFTKTEQGSYEVSLYGYFTAGC